MDIFIISAGILLGSALYTDLGTGRIPNSLTLAFACSGLYLNGAYPGIFHGIPEAFKGLGAGLALFIVPYSLGLTGGGDVKLFGALGAILGVTPVFWIFLYSALCAGIICGIKIFKMNAFFIPAGILNELFFHPDDTGKTIAYSAPAVLGYLIYLAAGALF